MSLLRRLSNLVLVTIGLLSALLVGCGRTPETTSPPTETTVATPAALSPAPTPTISTVVDTESNIRLTLWLSWDRDELSVLQDLIEAFQSENPGLTFSIRYLPEEDLLAAFQMAQQNDPHPALLFGPSSWGMPLLQEGLILGLNELVDAELMTNVSMLGWSQVMLNEQIVGLPLELQGMVLYRNASLAPDAPRSLSEWVETATDRLNSGLPASALDLRFETTTSQLAACGESLFLSDGSFGFSGEAGVCWLELLTEISQTGRVSFGADVQQVFASGDAAWWIGSTNEIRSLSGEVGEESLAIDSWPEVDETGEVLAGYVWSESLFISQMGNPGELEAAWRFSRFLLTPSSQRAFSDPASAAHIPVLDALDLTDPLMASASAAVQRGVPFPVRMDVEAFIQPLEQAVFDVLVQGRAPIDAIEAAEESIEFSLSILAVGGELPEETSESP